MRQFRVNLLWWEMRQTPRAPVTRRQLLAPAASHSPAASRLGALALPTPPSGQRPVHPFLCLGKLRHRDKNDPQPGEEPCLWGVLLLPGDPGGSVLRRNGQRTPGPQKVVARAWDAAVPNPPVPALHIFPASCHQPRAGSAGHLQARSLHQPRRLKVLQLRRPLTTNPARGSLLP